MAPPLEQTVGDIHPAALALLWPRRGPWTREDVERALENVCANRDDFPTCAEFKALGLWGLRKVVDRYGGAAWWAEHLGLRYEPVAGHPRWDISRIRRELGPYLARHGGVWPKHEQFAADGQEPLWRAIQQHGGRDLWAREMGVRVAPP